MRCIFEDIVLLVCNSVFDFLDLLSDLNKSIDE